jgi:hypothetical protein
LIEVLLLHRTLPTDAVVAGMRAALAVGTPNPELVAVEARRAAANTAAGAAGEDVTAGGEPDARVVSLPERPTAAALPEDSRPLPSVTPYDQLLRRRDPTGPTSTGPNSTGPTGDRPEPEEAV